MPPQPIDPWFWGGPYPYRHHYDMWGGGWYNPGPAQVQTVVTE